MVSALISRVVILVFGTLYPAYASYKAVKTKDVKEYVKWMMYWIVFALFTTVETFADVLVSWFPFYYELKIVFVVWLLSPATKGSSVLYRKFVHPELLKREQDIDFTIDKVKTRSYTTLVNVGQQGLNYAVQSAMTGQSRMMDHLMKKSFSLGDISRQQGDATLVTYRPSAEQIPEEIDEPDFASHGGHAVQRDAVPTAGMVTRSEVQGGVSEKADREKEFDAGPRQRDYNLGPHEYHGVDNTRPSAQHYHHNEVSQLVSPETKIILEPVKDPPPAVRRRKPGKAPSRSRSRSAGRRRKQVKKPATTAQKKLSDNVVHGSRNSQR